MVTLTISIHLTPVSSIFLDNNYIADKLDLINNLNSIKLLAVSEAFEAFPMQRVDVD